jgi:protein involved in polysaccharide export with SLBB domain
MCQKKKHNPRMNFSMKIHFMFLLAIVAATQSVAQVPTETELGNSKQSSMSRPGYYFYAKPFEVTMSVTLWGEVPQQGVYIIPTNTDIVQLISFAGGPKDRSNLEDVLLYRTSGKKDQRVRLLMTVNVRDILEGRTPTLPLAPGDMIVVKKNPEGLSLSEVLTIINTAATLTVLGLTVYNMKK